MIDRKEFAEEMLLRENVRKAIRHVLKRRNNEENELREVVRSLIEGQSAVASVAKHASTGINVLEDLLKNTNVLSVLETGYKSLTTDKQQRESYQNHILNAVEKSLAPEESRKAAGEDEELGAPVNEDLEEEIEIDVDRPEDDPDFISIEDEEEAEEPEADPKEEFGLEGEDLTGRNRAFTDFQDIEKVILTAYDNLDNAEDITMFEEYLLKNLALYFEKFESELQPTVEPPPEAAAAELDAEVDDGSDDPADVPEFELQEIIKHLNIDDIIENLL